MHCWRSPCPPRLCELPIIGRQPGSANPEAECKAEGANAALPDLRPQGLQVLAEAQRPGRRLRYPPTPDAPSREPAAGGCRPREHFFSTILRGALLNCAK